MSGCQNVGCENGALGTGLAVAGRDPAALDANSGERTSEHVEKTALGHGSCSCAQYSESCLG